MRFSSGTQLIIVELDISNGYRKIELMLNRGWRVPQSLMLKSGYWNGCDECEGLKLGWG